MVYLQSNGRQSDNLNKYLVNVNYVNNSLLMLRFLGQNKLTESAHRLVYDSKYIPDPLVWS